MPKTILLFLAPWLLTASLQAETPPLTPVKLSGQGAEITWEGRQFLQADQKGRVFLLDAAHLRVYPLIGESLGKPTELAGEGAKAGGTAKRIVVTDAALSPDGRDWLLQLFPHALRYFRGSEERSLPETQWAVSAVALPAGRPVLAVGLGSHGPAGATAQDKDPPLLLGLSDTKWNALVREPYDGSVLPEGGKGPMTSDFVRGLKAGRDFILARGAKGRIWLASRNLYRLRVYSPSGRLLDELTMGPQRIELRKRSTEEVETARQVAKTAESERDQKWVEYIASSPSPKAAIEAVAVDSASDTVFLVTAPVGVEGPSLDRFDRGTGRLERIGLRLPALSKGHLQAAAGKDGLYFADSSGNGGRWLLSWEALEHAKWKTMLPTSPAAP
jgi:hypothetical protein